MYAASLAHLRALCLALPHTTQTGAGDDPIFSVKGQTFATGHRVGERESVWFKATEDTRQRLLSRHGQRFFTPRYLDKHGWIGAWLDGSCDWSEIDKLLRDSYAMTAPASTNQDADAATTRS